MIVHWDAKNMFKTFPFFNTYIDKSDIKKISNIKLLQELLFHDELSIVKI